MRGQLLEVGSSVLVLVFGLWMMLELDLELKLAPPPR